MKLEFNDDGSLKVKGKVKEFIDSDKIFKNERAIKIVKDQVSIINPLKCELNLILSKQISKPEIISEVFNKATGKFRHMSQLKIKNISSNEYKVSIISGQYRCSWCENFINFIGEKMDCKIINESTCMSFFK